MIPRHLPSPLLAALLAAAVGASVAVPAARSAPGRKLLPKPGLYQPLTEPPCSYCSTQHRSGLAKAVHLATPVPLRAEQTLAVLSAGKHCACAVPMATDLDDLVRILAAQRRSGKN